MKTSNLIWGTILSIIFLFILRLYLKSFGIPPDDDWIVLPANVIIGMLMVASLTAAIVVFSCGRKKPSKK